MERLALLAIVGCYLVWGGGMIAMKYALQAFTAVQIITIRVVAPAIFYLFLWKEWKNPGLCPKDLKFFVLLTLCEPCLFFFGVTNALRFTSASEGGVIAATLPIFLALGGWVFLGEKMRIRAIFGMLLAFAGICAMNLLSVQSGHAPNPLLGNSLMLAAMIFSSFYTIIARHLSGRYSGLFISAFQAIGGSIVFIPFCLAQPLPEKITPQAIGGIIYLGLCIGIGVYLAYNWAMRRVRAGTSGILGNITPLTTIFLAWLVLGEKFNGEVLACMLLALAGIALAATSFMGGANQDADSASL